MRPVVAIHQPECFPWLGFVDKALKADLFILLDDVQFEKNYFQNRNRIRTSEGWSWLTVPVSQKGRSSQKILDVEISEEKNPRWREKQLASWRQHYGATPYWDRHEHFLESLYRRPWKRLVDFNLEVMREIFPALGARAQVLRSSEMKSDGTSTKKLLSLCQEAGAGTYLSGISGREYLDEALFEKAGIRVIYQEFRHPVYPQRYEPFEPCMSAMDLLLNEGPKSSELLLGSSSPRLEKVFL